MDKVTITNQEETDSGWRFTVVTPADTKHTVTLHREYYQKLSEETITPKELVLKSFAFLLDNEAATAILSTFELQDIENYFAEFPEQVLNY